MVRQKGTKLHGKAKGKNLILSFEKSQGKNSILLNKKSHGKARGKISVLLKIKVRGKGKNLILLKNKSHGKNHIVWEKVRTRFFWKKKNNHMVR